MTEADSARANAIALEVKKDGLVQKQNGDWRVSLIIAEMDQRFAAAPMGTRYQAVLVEVTDDETPRDYVAEHRDKWRDVGPRQQSCIRSGDPVFWAFLEEELHFIDVHNERLAAAAIKTHCVIDSRKDLDKPGNTEARQRWYALDNAFQAWKIRENA